MEAKGDLEGNAGAPPAQRTGPLKPGVRNELVPVTLRLEYKGRRIADKFLWSSRDGPQAALEFARGFCQDHRLHLGHAPTLAQEILRQVGAWMAALPTSSQEEGDAKSPCLQTIRLDCVVGQTRLQDCFQWDMNDPNPGAPELFALRLCDELDLGGAWPLELAICLRHQLALRARYLASAGAPQEEAAEPRPGDWGPRVSTLSREELAALLAARGTPSRTAGSQNRPEQAPPESMEGAPSATGQRQLRKRRGTRLAALLSSELGEAKDAPEPREGPSPPTRPRLGGAMTHKQVAKRAPNKVLHGAGGASASPAAMGLPAAAYEQGREEPTGRTGSASSLSNMLPSGFSQGLGQMPSVGGPLDNGLPPAAPPPISQYANLFADMF